MMPAAVDGSGALFKVGNVQALFPFRKSNQRWPYDVTTDGQRFLAITADDQAPTPMRVVVNWQEELKQRVPTRCFNSRKRMKDERAIARMGAA